MNDSTVTLLAAGIGAATALAGVGVTAWVSRSADAAKWRRDRRAETYVEMLAHFRSIRELAAPVSLRLPGMQPPGPALPERDAQLLVAKIAAFGSHRMLALRDRFSTAAVTAMFNQSQLSSAPPGSPSMDPVRQRRDTAQADLHATLTEIEDLVRQELQPEPLHRIRRA
ncbi:MAG TPA: hypothetical protein VGK55_15170, partial [Actinomycetes bacterium]